MNLLATDKQVFTLIYSSKSHLGKQVLGYVQGVRDALRTIDVAKTPLGHAVWVDLAQALEKDLGELFSAEHVPGPPIENSTAFSTDDWLKLIDKNPALLQRPIAVKGGQVMQVGGRSEVLRFFGVDSAGLEKKPLGESPTTSSTTSNETFI